MKNKKIKLIIELSAVLLIAFLGLFYSYKTYKKNKYEYEQEQIRLEELRIKEEKQRLIESLEDKGNYFIALNSKQFFGNYVSENEEIVSIIDGYISGNKLGETLIYSEENNDKYMICVTDLFISPTINNNKEYLPCNAYTKEESIILENALEAKIDHAGYKTRAGVVAAARFLALEFEYRIPYFYENGRLDGSTGHPYADGEGRYYHKGLYLNEDKYDELDPNGIVSGPQMWGCEMFSGAGGYIKNGLDCSGYVSWCLKQAGFDPGDVGGGNGIWDGAYNLPDLGVGDGGATKTSVVDPDAIQAGDIIAWEGTIAIVVGVDENNIYVAHEYWDNDLEVVTTPKDNLANSEWQYVTLMDNYYNSVGYGAGNYTNMW